MLRCLRPFVPSSLRPFVPEVCARGGRTPQVQDGCREPGQDQPAGLLDSVGRPESVPNPSPSVRQPVDLRGGSRIAFWGGWDHARMAPDAGTAESSESARPVLLTLAAGQFLMALDSSVMN